MDRRNFDAIRPQRRDHGIHFVTGKNEVSGNRRLTATSRLEIDRDRHPHRSHRSNLHSAFQDRIAPRHIELVDATVRLALAADELVELRCVEVDRWWRSGCGWRR